MKRFPFLCAILLFGLILPLYANARANIVVLGDSISSGYGIEMSQSWVSLLDQAIAQKDPHHSFQVINASITGDTTSGGLTRLPTLLTRYHPELLIIELGGNDGLRGISLKTTNDNLSKMIHLGQKAGSKVLLLGIRMPPNYGKKYTTGFAENYHHLAKQYHVALVPCIYDHVYTEPTLMQADGIHPNAQGQQQVLKNILPSVFAMLELGPLVKHPPDCQLA